MAAAARIAAANQLRRPLLVAFYGASGLPVLFLYENLSQSSEVLLDYRLLADILIAGTYECPSGSESCFWAPC